MSVVQRLGSASHERERAEVDAVLKSGIFDRSPSLSRFLSYICEKFFAGEADQIKEYSIAVEALGRRPDFDHTQDSIVRVEAHRLRKRLRDFYESEGADRDTQIIIPPGRYVPSFVARPQPIRKPSRTSLSTPELVTPAEAGPPPHGPELESPGHPRRTRKAWVAAAAAVVVVSVVAFTLYRLSENRPAQPETIELAATVGESEDVIRISAGSLFGLNVDGYGRVWGKDRYFEGGTAVTVVPPVELRGLPDWLFETCRTGAFRYHIPLEPGLYELRLHFAGAMAAPQSTQAIDPESRFNISVNGRRHLRLFDVVRDAGGRGIVTAKVIPGIGPAEDGILHLEFTSPNAYLQGLEVFPGVPGGIRPVRILAARTSGYRDQEGKFWTGDQQFQGGRTVARSQRVTGTLEPNLYLGERHGHFTYTLPVVKGSYTLKLMFAETWFGPGNAGGAGSRVFDVYCNGVALLKEFDVMQQAGSENRAVERVFHGLQPNKQDKLVLDFAPIQGDAIINAIELVQEAVDVPAP